MSLSEWFWAAAAPVDPTGDPSVFDNIAKIIDSLAGLVTAFGSLAGLAAAAGAVYALRKGVKPPTPPGNAQNDPGNPNEGQP
jgi:hypothetical protein